MVMTFTGTPASFVCLTGCRGVCVHVCFSIWHKGYGLSYRGDRWYVYRRMFAFCRIFNYSVCVCHRPWIYMCVRKTECVHASSSVCVREPLSITQNLLTSLLTVRLLPQSNPHSPSLLFFFWEVLQSKSKLLLSTVYWGCNTAQINTLVLFTKQTYSYTMLPPNPNPRKSQDWVVKGGGQLIVLNTETVAWRGMASCDVTRLSLHVKKAELAIHSNAWNELWWCLKYRKQSLTSTTLCGVLFKVPVDKEKGSRRASLTSICRVKDRMITEIKSVAICVTNVTLRQNSIINWKTVLLS